MSESIFDSEKVNYDRMPASLRDQLKRANRELRMVADPLEVNAIHSGDAAELLLRIERNSIALSVWSPPYFVGKDYEAHLDFEAWQSMLRSVIAEHYGAIKPGGFLVINIADILCFRDETMPKVQAANVSRHRSAITREAVLDAMAAHPNFNRYQLAELLGCSEQTIDRRLNGNNIRGGKYDTQTRVKIVGGLIEEWALAAGFYPYDRRIWVKDAAWENSRWATISYRAVDEFEYLYFFWKPGVTTVDRSRLSAREWKEWGSRGVWNFPSVRANDDHEAKFPLELPTRAIKLLSDPDDIVLDCFMGSGTSAVAAVNLGRRYLGIELMERYATLARKNVAEAESALRLLGQRVCS
jgi:site-specific DNA-methyltransferase (adenine-specific)